MTPKTETMETTTQAAGGRGSDGVLLLTSERFTGHAAPAGHPERPERAAVMAAVARRWADAGGAVAPPPPASTDALLQVHDRRHLDAIAAAAGRRARLDPDTYVSSDSENVARLAAGAAIAAADHAMTGARAAAFVRPPGHHAERDRAMGFCLYNNVAAAAAHALGRGAGKVAIVDYDVHHGNGSQWIFYDEPRVLYLSLHQYPFYPGTGAAGEVGRGAAAGRTVNAPLAAGAGDADYGLVFGQVVIPVLEEFGPDLILISAGYDAHHRDPLGGMRVSTGGYAWMTRALRGAADRCCGGRLAAVTEGGYDLEALEACLAATLEALQDPVSPEPPPDGSTERAEAALGEVRRALAPFWAAL